MFEIISHVTFAIIGGLVGFVFNQTSLRFRMLLLFIVLLVFARTVHLKPHKQLERQRHRQQRQHYRPRPNSRKPNKKYRQSSPQRRRPRQVANRSRKPVYFHDIYQQYAPNYPNYAPPKSYFGSQSDRDKLLAIHKRVRGRAIRWNPQIARLAQMHANGCPRGHANLPRGTNY